MKLNAEVYIEEVDLWTIELTVRLECNPRMGPKWNGYDLCVSTGEGMRLTIENVTIWGLSSWITAMKGFLEEAVYAKLVEITKDYSR